MAKSMTGFGRKTMACEYGDVVVEIRSVNSRFFELLLRDSYYVSPIEPQLRRLVSERIGRGKVDMRVMIKSTSERTLATVELNSEMAKYATQAAHKLEQIVGETKSADAVYQAVASIPGMFITVNQELTSEEMLALVLPVLEEALEQHQASSLAEGQRLADDMLGKLEEIEANTNTIATVAIEVPTLYKEKLKKRMAELMAAEDQTWLEQRLASEITIFADKASIDEELVRLKSHVEAMRKLLQSEERVGKGLEFLLQEMNREINTIGSKSTELKITAAVVATKNLLECLREQAQNLV